MASTNSGNATSPTGASQTRAFLDTIGSLWFAAVLMMLLLVGMASATVFESMHGTERALAFFYQSWWFVALLTLLAINVLAATLVRFPYSKRQIGFVITHAGILITLAGAAVTYYVGIDGNLGLAEGETVDRFRVPEDVLTVVDQRDNSWRRANLRSAGIGGFKSVDNPEGSPLHLGDLTLEVQRYLPDGKWVQRVVQNAPGGGPAAEVSLSATGMDDATWVFPDTPAQVGPAQVSYQRFTDAAALQKALQTGPTQEEPLVQVEVSGTPHDIPLSKLGDQPVKVDDTQYSIQLERYLPHATVGDSNKLENVSDKPVNPAVELQLIGPNGTEPRVAFAKFPDFGSRPAGQGDEAVEIRLLMPDMNNEAQIALLAGPEGALHVRFAPEGQPAEKHSIKIGLPIESPWPGRRFEVLQVADSAHMEWVVVPVEEMRETRQQMIQIAWQFGKQSGESWLQKYQPTFFPSRNGPYKITFADKQLLLGFDLTLNHFVIGRYPGEMRPRSFESHVTITDPQTGQRSDRVISMNHPVKYGGYSLFQSSYRMAGGQMMSFLSVSRDAGLPIVYVGYFAMLAGMVIVLITRVGEHRRAARAAELAEAQAARARR